MIFECSKLGQSCTYPSSPLKSLSQYGYEGFSSLFPVGSILTQASWFTIPSPIMIHGCSQCCCAGKLRKAGQDGGSGGRPITKNQDRTIDEHRGCQAVCLGLLALSSLPACLQHLFEFYLLLGALPYKLFLPCCVAGLPPSITPR